MSALANNMGQFQSRDATLDVKATMSSNYEKINVLSTFDIVTFFNLFLTGSAKIAILAPGLMANYRIYVENSI